MKSAEPNLPSISCDLPWLSTGWFSPGEGCWASAAPAQLLLPVPTSPLGDEIRDLEMVPDSMLHSSSERPTFIDRLANSLTKRKRSTPQKFVGKSPVVEETSAFSHSSSVSELQ